MALIGLAFVLVRLPVVLRQPGGMDEDWFAVPGLTVAREGIPRVPFAPERDRRSFFWKSDVALYALPPAYHYWQAPFFAVLPPTYGTARLASLSAGVVSLMLVYALAVRLLADPPAAILASALFSVSRVFFFPAMTARPDMLCTMFGLGALLALLHWRDTSHRGWLMVTGVLLGLGGLTHPFAIVFALQCGAAVLAVSAPWPRRLVNLILLGSVALAVFMLWTPLILLHPDIFRQQFFANVLSRSVTAGDASGLLARVAYQGGLLWEHVGPLQLALMTGGLAWELRRLRGPKTNGAVSRRWLGGLTLSAAVLLVLLQGRHPTKGYWVYPGALLFICLAGALADGCRWLARNAPRRGFLSQALRPFVLLVTFACMVPGCGLRTTWAYVRHRHDVLYDAPRFVRQVLARYPADAVFIVDPAYVLDVHVEGRKALLGVNVPIYFNADAFSYDYLLVSRYGLDNDIPRQLNGRRIAVYGNRDDTRACYLEVYVPKRR